MLPTYNVSNRNMKLKSIISLINYSAVTEDAALIKGDQLGFFKRSSLELKGVRFKMHKHFFI